MCVSFVISDSSSFFQLVYKISTEQANDNRNGCEDVFVSDDVFLKLFFISFNVFLRLLLAYLGSSLGVQRETCFASSNTKRKLHARNVIALGKEFDYVWTAFSGLDICLIENSKTSLKYSSFRHGIEPALTKIYLHRAFCNLLCLLCWGF